MVFSILKQQKNVDEKLLVFFSLFYMYMSFNFNTIDFTHKSKLEIRVKYAEAKIEVYLHHWKGHCVYK